MELLNKRTYTQKHFRNEDGSFKMKAHIGHVHYKENGEFKESNFTPVDKGTYWEMVKHNYHLRVMKDFSTPILMQFKNKFEGADHTITYKPHSLVWYNKTTDDMQVFRSQKAVTGVYRPKTNSFYYTNAFGKGIDFEITILRSGFKKEVVIPNKPNVFPTEPSNRHTLVALFKYGDTGLKVLSGKTKRLWNKEEHFESSDGFELGESNPTLKSFIRPAYAVDAEGNTRSLKVMWKKRNNQLWQIKEIPLKAMENAIYPVRFDTVTSYYTGSGDGGILAYKSESSHNQSKWNNVHDWNGVDSGVNGLTSYTSTDGGTYGPRMLLSLNANGVQIGRVFLPVDTSGLGSGATISAASFFCTTNAGDANWEAGLIEGTQTSTSSVVQADFDNIGTVEWATRVTISTTTFTEYELVLNPTGRDAINKTGWTKFSLVTGYDIDDNYTGVTNNGQNNFRYSEYTGTASDPYLEVTYSSGGGSPVTNTGFFAMM